MKKDLHPSEYRLVVFQDEAVGFSFLTKSTAQTNETIVWEDGKEYPLVKVYISSKSHPFFTGEEKIIDTEGRVDRFAAKMKAAAEAKAKKAEKVAKKTVKEVEKDIKPVAETLNETAEKVADKISEVVEDVIDAVKDAGEEIEKEADEK